MVGNALLITYAFTVSNTGNVPLTQITVTDVNEALPLVTLSQQDGPTGQWVKQPAMTAARQAAELAEFAVSTQGLRRFGIFYPSDPYGIGLSDAFRDEVQKRGGTVVGSVVYDPNQREHSVEMLSLAKWIGLCHHRSA